MNVTYICGIVITNISNFKITNKIEKKIKMSEHFGQVGLFQLRGLSIPPKIFLIFFFVLISVISIPENIKNHPRR